MTQQILQVNTLTPGQHDGNKLVCIWELAQTLRLPATEILGRYPACTYYVRIGSSPFEWLDYAQLQRVIEFEQQRVPRTRILICFETASIILKRKRELTPGIKRVKRFR